MRVDGEGLAREGWRWKGRSKIVVEKMEQLHRWLLMLTPFYSITLLVRPRYHLFVITTRIFEDI